jgi:site-specific DNA-methyltransferase (adenine-specific)
VPGVPEGEAMSEPYYSDDLVTLWHGDALDLLPELAAESVDVLLTDPPYFKVKDDEWDRQWAQRADFLAWLGSALDAATPALKASASVWVFASPALTSAVELEVMAPRFRVLNSIRWVKENGWHQKADIEAQRRYLTAWEGVLLAERTFDAYGDAATALHKQVFAPLGRYLAVERERAGLTTNDVDVALGYVRTKNPDRGTELCRRWEEGSSLPTERDYLRLRELLNGGLPKPYAHLRREYEDLRREYEDLRREYEDLRRPFSLNRKRGPVTDVWDFATVPPYAGKHPCEKPLSMLTHMIETTSRPGDLVLDPFAGSGSTLRAAKDLGRRAVGIEKDARYCDWIANRLAQDTLFGGVA